MPAKYNKLHVVHCFLNEHPKFHRFNCEANSRLIAGAIHGKGGWFYASEQESYLPLSLVEDAISRVRNQLADAFAGPVDRWLASHTEFDSCEANRQILLRALESEGATSTDDLEAMLDDLIQPGNPSTLNGSLLLSAEYLAERGQEEQRRSLAEKIISNAEPLKTGTTDREAERSKKKAREEWQQRIRGMALPDLIRVREKQRLRQGDVSDAQAVVQSVDRERQNELVDRQFQPIPELYFPANKDISVGVPWSPRLFHQLLPPQEISRLTRMYGMNQINQKLAEFQQKKS